MACKVVDSLPWVVTLYREIGVDLDRRLSHPLHLHLAYLHQRYDKTAIEGKGGLITTHIGIGELRWKASRNLGIRTELQYLHTQQDQGDWASALVEVSAFHNGCSPSPINIMGTSIHPPSIVSR